MKTPLEIHCLRLLAVILFAPLSLHCAEKERSNPSPSTSETGPKTDDHQRVQLTAFEVRSDPDASYGALNSNSITLFEIELQKLPISADIFTEAFMKDTGATSVEDIIQTYSAGAGYSGTDPSSTGGNTPGDRNSGAFIQLRGLQAPTIQRDGFMPSYGTGVGYTNNFDLERVEVVNGPQALLFGAGGAGGVMNLVSKQARLGKGLFGSLKAQFNEYGGHLEQLDVGFGTSRAAVRLAILEQDLRGRRDEIGGPLSGLYGQVAFKVFNHTVVRLSANRVKFDRVRNQTPAFAAQGGANADARNGQSLRYLLATDQLAASAGGRPSGAGFIGNGHINWDNVDSLLGWRAAEPGRTTMQQANVETKWNRWLSTQFSLGHATTNSVNVNTSYNIFPPNHTNNPLRVWSIGSTSTNRTMEATSNQAQNALRFSAMATNKLFNGRVTSQTIVGTDIIRAKVTADGFLYYLADASGIIMVNPNVTADNGRTLIPSVYWTIHDGINPNPLWRQGTPIVTYNGQTYARGEMNPTNPALISSANPLGVAPGGGVHTRDHTKNQGIFGANFSQWLGGRLTTMAGFRVQDVFFRRMQTPAAGADAGNGVSVAEATTSNLNLGVNLNLRSWLIPYIAASSSFNFPAVRQNDPYGDPPKVSKAQGQELGVKAASENGRISGSLAIFQVKSRDEQYGTTATLLNAINPIGLNGRVGTPNSLVPVDRESRGLQLTSTAAPSPNWRIRFSGAVTDGKIGSTGGYDQLYNDEFHMNASRQVTYRDGTVVYVPAAFNASSPTVPAGTPGAVPLTTAMMSTPGSPYYANPVAVSGAINGGSNAARVLQAAHPVNGPILTGRTGLPISTMQINPGFTPIGHIVTSTAGEFAVGYPKYSANMTSLYTFPSGWLKNFQLGGTAAGSWENRRYYYYPNGVSIGAARELFHFPDQSRFDLIVGYNRKFGRFGFSTQININNLFNRYDVIVLPNGLNGWPGPNNATFTQEPRAYLWTTTVSF